MKRLASGVTVIIPTTRSNKHLLELLETLSFYSRDEVEVIVLPNEPEVLPHCKVCATGAVGPAAKRDRGAHEAKHEILAFLDDDAYPSTEWLSCALAPFEDPGVGAVGGPAVTPTEDSFWARVSGAFYVGPFGGGNTERYWPSKKGRQVDDWPTVNFLVRRNAFLEVGGFQTEFWPGEDTKLCRDLVVKTHYKIVYEPRALVYHHRRPDLIRHLRQVGRYGRHRGFFTKKYPETSRRLVYFIPSLFLLAALLVTLLSPFSLIPLFGLMGAYSAAMAINSLFIIARERSFLIALAALPYTFLSHLSYGWQFMFGVLGVKNLRSQLVASRDMT